jgi:hypothetical protein
MKGRDNLVRIYTGTEISVILLKGRLEIAGISSAIQNDSSDSFLRGVPAAVDLYIQQTDFKEAEPIISEFVKNSNV